jgi:molybdate transport system substrate-binding protein
MFQAALKSLLKAWMIQPKSAMSKAILFAATFCVAAFSFAQEIIVAVAANAQFAMQDLEKAYEQKSGLPIKTVISSSGKLTAQIQNGAPFDVFLSADMKYPNTLYAAGFTAAKPRVYAYGSLVLWTMKEVDLSRGIKILEDAKTRKIAVANPQTAPYGAEAIKVLKHCQIYESVMPKLVYGESIAQVNQYIFSQAAEVGITAMSVVLSPEMRGKGKWIEIDSAAYSPIAQGAVILKHGSQNHPQASQAFYGFLFSEAARKILKSYGYLLP